MNPEVASIRRVLKTANGVVSGVWVFEVIGPGFVNGAVGNFCAELSTGRLACLGGGQMADLSWGVRTDPNGFKINNTRHFSIGTSPDGQYVWVKLPPEGLPSRIPTGFSIETIPGQSGITGSFPLDRFAGVRIISAQTDANGNIRSDTIIEAASRDDLTCGSDPCKVFPMPAPGSVWTLEILESGNPQPYLVDSGLLAWQGGLTVDIRAETVAGYRVFTIPKPVTPPPVGTPTPVLLVNQTAGSVTINKSTEANLSWLPVPNAKSCSGNFDVGTTPEFGGFIKLFPTETTTYTLTCKNLAGAEGSSSVVVTVVTPPAPTPVLLVNQTVGSITLAPGSKAYVSWATVPNAVSCTTNFDAGANPPHWGGFVQLVPTATITYTLICRNSVGVEGSSSVVVTVGAIPTPVPNLFVEGQNVSTIKVAVGTMANFYYGLVADAKSCSFFNGVSSVDVSTYGGSFDVKFSTAGTVPIKLTCNNGVGGIGVDTIIVTVQ